MKNILVLIMWICALILGTIALCVYVYGMYKLLDYIFGTIAAGVAIPVAIVTLAAGAKLLRA